MLDPSFRFHLEEKKKMRMNLEMIQKADAFFGFPSKSFSSIHVAGTNGKGSVCVKIGGALQKKEAKIGVFTSPHIFSPRERIQVNGVAISRPEFEDLEKQIEPFTGTLTFFEKLTLMAFLYFKQKNVDWAVIEVGLGGRRDATNILRPKACVITSIGWDHCSVLGDSLEKIAVEKGGIIKEMTPVVIGHSCRVGNVIENIANVRLAPLKKLGAFEDFDEENTALAKAVVDSLGYDLPLNAFLERPPLRYHQIHDQIPVVLDVAHNKSGIEAFCKKMAKQFHDYKRGILVAMQKDKDQNGLLQLLKRYNLKVTLLNLPEDLEKIQKAYLELLSQVEVVGVCGSFRFFPYLLPFLQKRGVELSAFPSFESE